MIIDWLCFKFVCWFPIWKLDPASRFYGGFILPRAGRWAYRDCHDEAVK